MSVLFLFLFFLFNCEECNAKLEINGFKNFKWFNNPKHFVVSPDYQEVTTTATPFSDYWRITWYGFTRDSGNFFYTTIPIEETVNTTISVAFDGKYLIEYDQSGIMIRLDSHNWMKTGIEYDIACPRASCVITNEYSDWSVIDLCKPKYDFDTFYIKVFINEISSFEVSYSFDNKNWSLLRIGRLNFTSVKECMIGIYTASPGNKDGFDTKFTDFKIEN